MGVDEMTGSQSTAQRQFPGENTSSNDASKFASIITRICWMRTSDAKQIKHGTLWLKNCTTSQGTHFDRWHGNTNLEVSTKTEDHG
jgi:hypothetical protein